MMTTYDLGREDWDSIVELNQFPGQPNTVSNLPSKVHNSYKSGHLTNLDTGDNI